ncbi:MAG: hypothetical protein M1824_005843 [Vezdaea acicularis]|nr:MAG: hypothetical protein M1824_005843 [Vezdaea acicularis]
MATFSTIALFVALRFFLLLLGPANLVGAVPTPQISNLTGAVFTSQASAAPVGTGYWLSTIQRQGQAAFNGAPSTYKVYRNVKDFGAKGDGSSDDTDAINTAISTGGRCGQGCDSSTVTPALVYFPPGTYVVSKPIVQYYFTQLVGDAVNVPTIKASPSFQGIAVIDSDPYDNQGNNWWTNQNNFYRQVRNFVIDITAMPPSSGACIHWQVAQATSLQRVTFNMVKGGGDGNKQLGIFMDNGSGGFMTDLVFNGGNYGAFFGNQQFTTRNLTFNNVQTAIFMNWNWLWTFKSLSINNCGVGVNMSNGAPNQTVGSVLIQDSTFSNTPIGVATAFSKGSDLPATGGTLIIDNCDFSSSAVAVQDTSGATVLAGNSKVASWGQGKEYTSSGNSAAAGSTVQGVLTAPSKPATLLNSQGNVVERTKPQYETVPVSSFVSVKSNGAKGDGSTDDTDAIQKIFNSATPDQIIYFDHGAYVISSTVKVPKDIKITGEIWPIILISGSAFQDEANPIPAFQVGQPGDTGTVEISDLVFEVKGPQPGAIMMEWNVADPSGAPASSGLWDVHWRIGGSAGTSLQSDKCAKTPSTITNPNSACVGSFMMMHVTKTASIYMENVWFWVADHELDLSDHGQINIYNGRGVLIESQTGAVWLYGTASEHSQLYNYQLANAKGVYMGLIQTETAYMQSNPNAMVPFKQNPTYNDPTFSECKDKVGCPKTWGLRVLDSSDLLVYGAGLYSFFENYDQTCLATESCQENMVSIENSTAIHLFGLSTKASTNMVTVNGAGVVDQKDNRNNFCSTLALFAQP